MPWSSSCARLPARIGAPILVTQHLPTIFMPYFARQLETASGRAACVAEDGQPLVNELIHVAPGDAHLCVGQKGARVLVRLDRKCAPSGCLPSVDPMLASVADIYGERAIGVILSGMGRDGLLGSQRAGRAGRGDAGPGPGYLGDLGNAARGRRGGARLGGAAARRAGAPDRPAGGGQLVEISSSSQRILSSLLEARTGQQLTFSRRWRIDSALSSIVRERGFENIDQLVARVVSGRDPALAEQVIEALLNNETYFFRDRLPFEMLVSGAVRRFEKTRAREKRLSIWCAGCSTGQEAYSLAMSFAEDKSRWQGWKIDIVGTDLSRACIDRARSGSLFPVRGPARPAGGADDPLVRRNRAAASGRSSRTCATASASSPATSPSRRRGRAGSTSSCAATSCSISRPRCGGWPSPGSPRRSRPTAP